MCTKGKILFGAVLVILGLLLVGCDSAKAVVPAAGKHELTIEYLPPDTGQRDVKIKITGDQSVTVNQHTVIWFYDVPEEKNEYAAMTMVLGGDEVRDLYLHLHISKKPPAQK